MCTLTIFLVHAEHEPGIVVDRPEAVLILLPDLRSAEREIVDSELIDGAIKEPLIRFGTDGEVHG